MVSKVPAFFLYLATGWAGFRYKDGARPLQEATPRKDGAREGQSPSSPSRAILMTSLG